MKILNKIYGKFLLGLAKLFSGIFDILISITSLTINLVKGIAKGFLAILGMGGCLFLIILSGPFGIFLLLNPLSLFIFLFFIIFPILGSKFLSYLKYLKYSITEYLYDLSNYYISNKEEKYKDFKDYGKKYKKMEDDRKRAEYEKRKREEEKIWEERFKQWNQYQGSQYRSYDYRGQNSTYGNYVNPSIEFKSKYEKSCNILELPFSSDKYEIKLAYRKKAKQYHPDLNHAENATKIFQEINDAYEFLSEENIERYKKLNN